MGTKNKVTGNALVKFEKTKDAIAINLSGLRPPKTIYYPDAFAIRKCFGYSDFYFGQRDPRNTDKPILTAIIIRVPEDTINKLIIKEHKPFYQGIFASGEISQKHYENFEIDVATQFPDSNFAFFSANFLYGAHGNGEGELMFYRISPSYVHHLVTGKPAIIPDHDQDYVEDVLTVRLPVQLLAFVYHSILENEKNE